MIVDPERLKLLIEDLRTTTAPQVTGHLRKGDGYCCMGRMCVAAMAFGLDLDCAEEDGTFSYDGSTEMLPDRVADFFGFGDINPMIRLPHPHETPGGGVYHNVTLGYANDTIGLSFIEIADALEATYITGQEQP